MVSIHHLYCNAIITTPHILTEVSNLSAQIDDSTRNDLFTFLSLRIVLLDEFFEPSQDLVTNSEFQNYGLTDSAIYSLASRQDIDVLTIDFRLAGQLSKKNITTINFNHLRKHIL